MTFYFIYFFAVKMWDESCLGIILQSAGWIALDYMIPGTSHIILLYEVIDDIFAGKYGAVKGIQQAVAKVFCPKRWNRH